MKNKTISPLAIAIIFPVCLILSCALMLIPALGYAQDVDSSTLDALSKMALEKIDKALKDKATDPKTKDKLDKVAKEIRKGALVKGSSSGIAKGDFNGDGFADLAIGLPHEDTPVGTVDSGAVIVIYGGPLGLNNSPATPILPAQFWSQNAPGVPGDSQAHDNFGAALASGDFNGDGFSDLAIGIPGKTVDVHITNGGDFLFANSGRVVIIYGSANGLTTTNPTVHPPQTFDLSVFGLTNIKGGERLGFALAWGDFNGDGVGDLAMGIPGRDVIEDNGTTVTNAGEVWVLFGSKPVRTCLICPPNPATGGLTRSPLFQTKFVPGEEFLNGVSFVQNNINTGLGAEVSGAGFGTVLAAGDFNGDGLTDLAVGVPNLGFGGNLTGNIKNAGGVIVFEADTFGDGLESGGDGEGAFLITELSSQIPIANAGDNYGKALAVGDFNGDGRADLAIGIPNRAVGANAGAGVVHVRYGHSNANSPVQSMLPLTGSQLWTQNALFPGDPQNRSEAGDAFGAALAAGDFNGDGKTDLAIGVPLEDVLSDRTGTLTDVILAGEVDVVYGSTGPGLSITVRPPQIWTQDTINIQGQSDPGDMFGFSLTAWDFGDPSAFVGGVRGTQADLAIGVPFEDLFQTSGPAVGTLVSNCGAVNVIYGSPPGTVLSAANGLTTQGNQFWFASAPGIPSGLQQDAHFGFTLY